MSLRVDLDQISEKINDIETGTKNYEELENLPDINSKKVIGSITFKLSDFENDTNFITTAVDDLLNYYAKGELYTKEEVNTIISNINSLNFLPVDELPTTDISETTIYMLKVGENGSNKREEYLYVNGEWELIGSNEIDLTGYLKTEALETEVEKLGYIKDVAYATETTKGVARIWNETVDEENILYIYTED